MSKLFYIMCFLAGLTSVGQNFGLEKLSEVTLITDRFVAVDKFNALYHIKNNILFKKEAHTSYQFSALQLGLLSSVDVLNPLRITLYYEESNTAVILDNTLNEITRINFSTINNFRNISHVTTASDRRLWIFNTDAQRLEIFDWNQEKVLTQFPPMEENARSLTSNFNFAWVTTRKGIYHYNNYGSFLHTISIPEIDLVAQDKGSVIAFAKAKLHYKPKDCAIFQVLESPDLTIEEFSLNGEILYIYSGQKLTTFRLKSSKRP